jgi:hypothetical protein
VVDVLLLAFEYAGEENRAVQWFLTQKLGDFRGLTTDQLGRRAGHARSSRT